MHQAAFAERCIGHHRHATLLAPGQEVILNAAVAEIVQDLIGRAAVAVGNTEEVLHVTDCEVGDAPGANFPAARRLSNPATIRERSSMIPFGQCSK